MDLEGHIQLVPRLHYHQDVHIAVFVRRAVGMRAEQDDLLGLKSLGNLARETADHAHRDVSATVPALRLP